MIPSLRVSLTPQATDDLVAIRDWIADDDRDAADRVIDDIIETTMKVGRFPMIGRPGAVDGTREFAVVGLPYLIVYRFASGEEIDVLTVLHTRRRYPVG
jgi:toxin ParE1/3/4